MLWNAKNGQAVIPGSEMPWVSFGQGKKALVLLPGLSDGLATVEGKALMLAPPYRRFFGEYTVYMFSRRKNIPHGFTVRDMARDQALAMEALGIRRACVMGVSQGGMIAQYLAADRPGMVEKLVLAVTAPYANASVLECVSRWIGFAEKGDHRSLMTDTAEMSYSPEHLKKYRLLYPALGKVGRPRDGYERFLANARAILGFDARDALKNVRCPALVIGGEGDRIVGAEASRELHALLPGSELFLYKGLGHAAYEEAKDFNSRVYGFLERSV